MGRWVGEHGQNRIGNSHLDSHEVNPLQSGLMSRESMNSRVCCVSKPLSCPHHLVIIPTRSPALTSQSPSWEAYLTCEMPVSSHRGWSAAE